MHARDLNSLIEANKGSGTDAEHTPLILFLWNASIS